MGSIHHLIQDFPELFKAGCWNNNGVTTTTDILGNAQEFPAWILFQSEKEGFSFDLNLIGFKRVFVNGRFGGPVSTAAIRS